jgi:glutaredoxin
VKEFLSRHSVEFTDRNVAADEAALAELEAMGYHTTPVTIVGQEVVVGFDRARLTELLQH